MGNAGEARLDVVALGRDEVTAVMNKVGAELDQLKAKLAGYERAQKGTGQAASSAARDVGTFGERVGGLKEKVSGVNKVREVFENLRSNAGFVIGTVTALGGAIVGVVSGIVDLVNGADKASIALKRWEENQKAFNAAATRGWEALDRFARTDVEKALGDVNVQLIKAEELLRDLASDEDEWFEKSKELADLKRVQAALESDIARDAERSRVAIEGQVRAMRDREAAALEVPIISPFTGNADDLVVERNIFGEVETPDQKAARLQRLEEAKRKASRGGGGGSSRTDDSANRFRLEVERQRDLARAARLAGGGMPEFTSGGPEAMPDNIKPMGIEIQKVTSDTERWAEALERVGDATALVSEEMPELGSVLSEISGITQSVVDGKMELGEALAASGAAIAANAAKAIGGVRAEAAVRSAYEVGMGFATLANPAESAGHFTAAALLGVVAAGAGGGGSGGARGAGAGALGNTSSGNTGPTTIVYSFSTLVTDRQQVTSVIQQAQRSSRGTGEGRGV